MLLRCVSVIGETTSSSSSTRMACSIASMPSTAGAASQRRSGDHLGAGPHLQAIGVVIWRGLAIQQDKLVAFHLVVHR